MGGHTSAPWTLSIAILGVILIGGVTAAGQAPSPTQLPKPAPARVTAPSPVALPAMPPAQLPPTQLPAAPPTMSAGEVTSAAENALRESEQTFKERLNEFDPKEWAVSGITEEEKEARLQSVAPRDSHWMRWWEANRERYWPEPMETAEAAAISRKVISPREAPESFQAALEKATRSKQTSVRSQAALAIGLTMHPRGFALLRSLINDPDDTTAIHAWAALGLVGGSEEVAEFLKKAPTSPRNTMGWALCIGLHPSPDPVVWDKLIAQVREVRTPESRRLALWALRMHKAPGTHELSMELIQNTNDRDLFAEAVLALGNINYPDGQKMLTDLIRMSEAARAIPLVANDPDFKPDVSAPHVDRPLLTPPVQRSSPPIRVSGVPHDYRALAILAAMESGAPSAETLDAIRATAGTWTLEEEYKTDQLRALRKRMSPEEPVRVVALGSIGRPDDATILNRMLWSEGLGFSDSSRRRGGATTFVDWRNLRSFPSRPMAAMGIGLALRRTGDGHLGAGSVSQDTGASLPPAAGRLAETMQDTHEPIDLRAACAAALGLSHSPSQHRLKDVIRNVKPTEEQIYGFSVMALGMLGDPQTVELAADALGKGKTTFTLDTFILANRTRDAARMPLDEMIGRRAIVDGLAALGNPRAVPILFDQWGRDDSLTLDTARALARCFRPAVMNASLPELNTAMDSYTKTLIDAINLEASSRVSSLALASLAILYAHPEMFHRLGTITAGSDYTVRPVLSSGSGKINLNQAYPAAVIRLSNPYFTLVLR